MYLLSTNQRVSMVIQMHDYKKEKNQFYYSADSRADSNTDQCPCEVRYDVINQFRD